MTVLLTALNLLEKFFEWNGAIEDLGGGMGGGVRATYFLNN